MKTLALILAAAATLSAQVAESANKSYQTPAQRESMLRNLAAADRADRLKGSAIVQALRIQPGMTVADLGTGGGAMLPLFSAAVGAGGKVIAEDIFPDFLERAKANNGQLSNVTYVLGAERDAKLAAGSADVAVTVDSYHHYDYPREMLASIKRGLKPGGRFVIVDYFKRDGAMGPGPNAIEHIRLDKDDVVKEVESYGFQLLESIEHVPGKQYIAVFTARP
jgi:ubiquinone/menaquinone biosynthesis C-methylase UbiE